MTSETDLARELLRHTLATLAYRGGKAIRDINVDVANYRASETTRTPLEILAHIGDLLEWALTQVRGEEMWRGAEPQTWPQEVDRFFATLAALEQYLASAAPLACAPQRLFQAPIADALTHVGQIAMLRRMAGSPMRGENYFKADIEAGRVGAEQSARRFEFD
ncbi:MAG TPA: hypothetical protein VGO73_14400 [Pyrinomonadaceae bacterium]|jgi:hypothetical protein|nr:hypothetical protein [Pyrinomonadaceae bacterium]